VHQKALTSSTSLAALTALRIFNWTLNERRDTATVNYSNSIVSGNYRVNDEEKKSWLQLTPHTSWSRSLGSAHKSACACARLQISPIALAISLKEGRNVLGRSNTQLDSWKWINLAALIIAEVVVAVDNLFISWATIYEGGREWWDQSTPLRIRKTLTFATAPREPSHSANFDFDNFANPTTCSYTRHRFNELWRLHWRGDTHGDWSCRSDEDCLTSDLNLNRFDLAGCFFQTLGCSLV